VKAFSSITLTVSSKSTCSYDQVATRSKAIRKFCNSVPAIVFASVTGAVNNKSQKLTTVTSMNKAIFPQWTICQRLSSHFWS